MAWHEPLKPHHTDTRNPAQPFCWPVRVYYEDTDSGGVVYYANYLRFLERARTEWLRALGFEQTALAAQHHALFVVRAVSLEFIQPARFDDALNVTVEPINLGASQISIEQRVSRAAQVLVQAQVRIACVNLAAFKPVRIPRAVHAAIAAGVIHK